MNAADRILLRSFQAHAERAFPGFGLGPVVLPSDPLPIVPPAIPTPQPIGPVIPSIPPVFPSISLHLGPGPVVIPGGPFATAIARDEGPLVPVPTSSPDVPPAFPSLHLGPGPVIPNPPATGLPAFPSLHLGPGPVIPNPPATGLPAFPSLHFGPGPVILPESPAATVTARRFGPIGPVDPVPTFAPDVPPSLRIIAREADESVGRRFEGPLGPDIPGFKLPLPPAPDFEADASVVPRFSGPLGPDIPHLGPGLLPSGFRLGPGIELPPSSVASSAPAPTATVVPRFSGPLGPDVPGLFPSGFRLGPGIELAPSNVAPAASTPDATLLPRLTGPIGPVIPNLGPGIEIPPDQFEFPPGSFGPGPVKFQGPAIPTPLPGRRVYYDDLD